MDGGGKGGPGDAEEDVHTPRQSVDGGTVDAEGGVVPQAQADQQHLGQARLCKYCTSFFVYRVDGSSEKIGYLTVTQKSVGERNLYPIFFVMVRIRLKRK